MITVWGHTHLSRQADDSCLLLIARGECCSQLGRGFISYIWSVAIIVCSAALRAGCSLGTPPPTWMNCWANNSQADQPDCSNRFWTVLLLTCQQRNEKHIQNKYRACVPYVTTKSMINNQQAVLNLPHIHILQLFHHCLQHFLYIWLHKPCHLRPDSLELIFGCLLRSN